MGIKVIVSMLVLLFSTLAFADCGWYFHINNRIDRTVKIYYIETRTIGPSFKLQWTAWYMGGSVDIKSGEVKKLPTYLVPDQPFSFRSDSNCNKDKKIDFQVHFSCDGIPGNFWKKALNRVRDGGDYTMYLDLCTNVVN